MKQQIQFRKAYISFGANLAFAGQAPEQTILAAMQALDDADLQLINCSSLWASPAWPDANDPSFVNAVALFMCHLTPLRLMNRLGRMENRYGRVRNKPNAPRTLDLDLISYGGLVSNTRRVKLPHPGAGSRAFVLLPLHEIAPDWKHPITAEPIGQMIADLPVQDKSETKLLKTVQIDIA
ncbi:2-amino-4-hydroxy-6-hydroxymethyldihydropteridinepyrophosphokinase [hydrothermal vent metagenome]|uniref:2-amino-4-hydroxy-6-hydroxymethyldihydropteridine diphosphokinase n=1 Tax=hydrothermal vent metagenome TaxID=652676 RepID=A0A3B0SQA1_9ZZZZ